MVRLSKLNSLVAQLGTNPKWIEKAGWFADLGTFVKCYKKVCSTPVNMLSYSNRAADDFPQRLLQRRQHCSNYTLKM